MIIPKSQTVTSRPPQDKNETRSEVTRVSFQQHHLHFFHLPEKDNFSSPISDVIFQIMLITMADVTAMIVI